MWTDMAKPKGAFCNSLMPKRPSQFSWRVVKPSIHFIPVEFSESFRFVSKLALGLNLLLTRAGNISNISYNLGKLYMQFVGV
jgi:hypothetical protein